MCPSGPKAETLQFTACDPAAVNARPTTEAECGGDSVTLGVDHEIARPDEPTADRRRLEELCADLFVE
jgi:hypothetical protein